MPCNLCLVPPFSWMAGSVRLFCQTPLLTSSFSTIRCLSQLGYPRYLRLERDHECWCHNPIYAVTEFDVLRGKFIRPLTIVAGDQTTKFSTVQHQDQFLANQ